MRRPVFLIFVNAMILIVIFALLTQSLFVVQRLAQASAVVGLVQVQRSGKGDFRLLAERNFVKTGDLVRTGSDGSAVFSWADGTRWKVMPNTLLHIKKAASDSAQKAEPSHLALVSGKVFVRATRALPLSSGFEVETPGAVATARGTIFSVEVRDGATQVQVWKGLVALSGAGGQRVLVKPGQTGRASSEGVGSGPDAVASQEFEAQDSIVRPRLEARAEAVDAGHAMVSGRAEAGDEVLVNGQVVRVLGNGAFRFKMPAPLDGRLVVEARDRHGAASTWYGSLPPGPAPAAR